jgi:hypothetical protein
VPKYQSTKEVKTYNDASRCQECKNVDIHEVRGPSGWLMLTHTCYYGDVFTCICPVKPATPISEELILNENVHFYNKMLK